MSNKIMNNSICFLNAGVRTSLTLTSKEWLYAAELTPEFMQDIKNAEVKALFIQQQNIFSHAVNVLRKVLFDTNTIAVMGAEAIIEQLKQSSFIEVNIAESKIIISDTIYCFRSFDYLKDTSEILEYNLDSLEICYKPDYYYNKELAEIIINGYHRAETILPVHQRARRKEDGRIWNLGFMYPHQIFEYYKNNQKMYYSSLYDYTQILEKLLHSKRIEAPTESFTVLLSQHFSYSMIFSFTTPNISEELKRESGTGFLELVYTRFVENSPIHDKTKNTESSLKKLQQLFENKFANICNSDNFRVVYNIGDVIWSDLACMFFVNNMISDVRRCVINSIIESNLWFASICNHRKKPKLY